MHPLVYPAMGIFALGVLWLNTLLIVADALQTARALGSRLATLATAQAAGRLVRAEITRGDGPGGAFVTRSVEQVGRTMTVGGPDRILLTSSEVTIERHGGELSVEGRLRAVPAGGAWDVWLAPGPLGERAHADFDAAFALASTQRGLATRRSQALRAGAAVHWLEGELLAVVDPIAELRTRRAGLFAFALAALLGCGAVTALALVPPVFGTVSTVGGAAALLFFVLVQPAGVRMRNWARIPSARSTTDVWQRPPAP